MNYMVLNTLPSDDGVVNETSASHTSHLRNILKKGVGDQVKVKVLGFGCGTGTLVALDGDKFSIKVHDLQKIKDYEPGVTLAIGACRPLMVKRILEHGATLGVKKFIFFKSVFSEKSYLSSSILREANYQKYLLKGLSQTKGSIYMPKVEVKESIEEIDLTSFSKRIFLHGPGKNYLKRSESLDGEWIIFLGSERGWHENEFSFFKKTHIEEIAISKSVLRVEFAMASIMAQIDWIKNASN